MRSMNIDRGWTFKHGMYSDMAALMRADDTRTVNLPHDYMIESEVTMDAPALGTGGYYTESTAHYTKMIEIPAGWKDEVIYLKFDGVMMNATVDVNGGKAALQHYGYAPFYVDITPYVYFGKANRVTVTVNPSMQPNSRWYSGAGIFRSVQLVHMPKLHLVPDGIYTYTRNLERGKNGEVVTAYLASEVTVKNQTLTNRMAMVEVWLTEDGENDVLIRRKQKLQINPNTTETAYLSLTFDAPKLWDTDSPFLYQVHAKVTDLGEFRTHHLEMEDGETDEDMVLFGIRTISADVKHGLQINGKTVKLKGGCLHHDNGILGAVSLYDAEYRKLSLLKTLGFNAVRTTHNPPSSVFLEACDRLGMYVFDEAFDMWGMMKTPGDYSLFFETDWKKDLTAFLKRDRNHPSVIIWSVGNEIPERGGLNNGYTLSTVLANHVRTLDRSRPVSNAVCSFWSGLDDELTAENMKKWQAALSGENVGVQNADFGSEDLSWENWSEAFTNGLDIVGYNYMEDKYPKDHELYPERVILGSENYPKEIGKRWPMVEATDYVIGDFTWTAFDYIGEAGIGKTAFVEAGDPLLKAGPYGLMSHTSVFPWRLANDADFDINGNILPQGCYRSVVWGSDATHLFSYDPENFGKTEIVSMWGFTDVRKCWNYAGYEGKNITLAVFSNADEVELQINGKTIGRKKAGETPAVEELPKSFVFDGVYEPGEVTAISYKNGKEVSRDSMRTTGKMTVISMKAEKKEIRADGHSLCYIPVELMDENKNVVPDQDMVLTAKVTGKGELLGFGSGRPVTDENYTGGTFTTYRGRALAVIRSGYETGDITLTVTDEEGNYTASCTICAV